MDCACGTYGVTYLVWEGKPEGNGYRVVYVRVLLNWFFKGYNRGRGLD